MARAHCLYCGKELPPDLVPSPESPEARPAGAPPDAPEGEERSTLPRVLVVLDLDTAREDDLGRALGLSPYEAGLLARRRGYHLHRIVSGDIASDEAARLRQEGLRVELLPESEARTQPVRAHGGERAEGRLELETDEGRLTLAREDVLLIVRGPIARQYQPTYRRRRVEIASPEEGYRVHFHRHSHPRPLEIDAGNFEFGVTLTGSTRLELDAWVDGMGADLPRDDGFRRLPPAFGVATPETKGPLAAASSLSRAHRAPDGPGESDSVVLDNAAQFIFYSAWRAALERRRGD